MRNAFLVCFGSLLLTALFNRSCPADLDYDLSEGVIVDEILEPAWTGSFAAGLNGKSGNSESLDINMTLNLARETDATTTTILVSYFYGSNAIATVTDRTFAQFRRERKLADDRWSLYYQSAWEWDRFKAFDYRVAIHGGFAFVVFKEDDIDYGMALVVGF